MVKYVAGAKSVNQNHRGTYSDAYNHLHIRKGTSSYDRHILTQMSTIIWKRYGQSN